MYKQRKCRSSGEEVWRKCVLHTLQRKNCWSNQNDYNDEMRILRMERERNWLLQYPRAFRDLFLFQFGYLVLYCSMNVVFIGEMKRTFILQECTVINMLLKICNVFVNHCRL